ncbi:alpha/beta fold hydrolase [Hespellia stercorisuis]|uniref:Pimeloyl-ACP methyl ester carboxylesterase n=1 Tax=Hespellia stercorisuis DSM 15480 TaxID=1121950 RepID=A0A1M6RA99_9FIRM|nr:alpha/beta hydrolase [Hespellia stercorisuis]SHK29346.1 Pimeloyl-ACP methyl ester carboxylesterase [Hespellia stercorisuis DSM 15480]
MQKKMTRRRRAAFWILLILGLLLIIYNVVKLNIYVKAVAENEISSLEKVELGGYDQYILCEGKKDAPVLVMLHGGPMTPSPFGIGYRGAYPELTKEFLVVSWDEYGCGKNFVKDTKDFTAQGQVDIICDLVRWIKRTYSRQNIYLFGYSNGSLLTMEVAKQLGNQISGVINNGPITSMQEDARDIIYQVLGEVSLTNKQNARLEEDYKKDNAEGFTDMEALVNECTDRIMIRGDDMGLSSTGKVYLRSLRILFSPDYNLLDLYHAFYYYLYGESAYAEVCQDYYVMDEKPVYESLNVPVLILQADGDVYGRPEYFKELAKERENITYMSIKNCGHFPTNTGMDTILKEMTQWIQREKNKEG